jgi:hypothetical protein
LEEVTSASLLEETHERARDGLHLGRRDLGDAAVAVDVRGGDLLKLEVSGDVGVNEDTSELARGHHELGDEVDGDCAGRQALRLMTEEALPTVAITSEFLWRRLPWAELLIELRGPLVTPEAIARWFERTWVRLRDALSPP